MGYRGGKLPKDTGSRYISCRNSTSARACPRNSIAAIRVAGAMACPNGVWARDKQRSVSFRGHPFLDKRPGLGAWRRRFALRYRQGGFTRRLYSKARAVFRPPCYLFWLLGLCPSTPARGLAPLHPTLCPFFEVDFGEAAQFVRRLFRRKVALGFGHHLVTHHEFLDGGRPQQRRVEVGV